MAAERAAFRAEMAAVPAEKLVFLDESGVKTTMTATHGRAPRGVRVVEHVPHGHWKVLTVLGALTVDGLTAAMTIAAPTDGDVFRTYVTAVLVPTLRPGQVVVMDNLPAHKVPGVQAAIEKAGCTVRYLPPYSPDDNPIEPAWSKLKAHLRAVKARALGVLDEAVGVGLRHITAQDAQGYFRHCGYALQ